MLKFNNIIWLLRKNFFITFILLVLVLFFSFYVNFTTVNDKLINNNKLISHSIQNAIKQHKIRLDLYSKALEMNPSLKNLDLNTFSAFYYLNEDGEVLDKISSDEVDPLKKFIEINTRNLTGKTTYISELITTKDLQSSIYFAKKLENNKNTFLVAKLDLKELLKSVNKFNTDYILVDSFGNVLYSSNQSKLDLSVNVNEFSYYWYLSGIYQTASNSDNIIKEVEYSGFNVRSFISASEYFNYYFVLSAFLLIILVMYFWNAYLDSMLVENGLVRQVRYCYDLQGASDIDEFQNFELIEGSDLEDLQKQTAFSVLEYKDIKKEYRELEQRLSSMFSKSTIPMLMIDAFTAKIFKANQSALDFYNQKITGMSKMNLYMLGKKEQRDTIIDPINFANNMQNSIKNQGFYIQTEHYVNGEDFKEVKIYPFVMRSERFCYDILMILDTNMVSKSYENIKSQYEALEKSFIITMNFTLKGGKLKIRSCSKNIDRILGYTALSYTYFKELLHKSSYPAYIEFLLKLKNLKDNSFTNYSKVIEQNLYLRQNNGRYAEFKVSFNISRDYNYDSKQARFLNITAHLALLKQDILEDEIKEPISFSDIYKQSNSIIGIFDKEFKCISANKELRNLLNTQNVPKIYLKDLLAKEQDKIIANILDGKTCSIKDIVYLKDFNNILHPNKLSYVVTKNSLGENLYCLIFRQEYDPAELDNFVVFCKNRIVNNENLDILYCEYYYKVIGNRINNNESFDNLDFDKFLNNIRNFDFTNEELAIKADYMSRLVSLVKEKNRDKIMQMYENGNNIFIGDIYEQS
ncbi:cache domain-containing protein [Campylobacter sp. RM9333]|uniref:hypothetical protein n=1 Tax=Campylobacter sp. RM9333 TaxID=2735731 RepID=UPI001DB65FE0|nr:cache domain-containing protein [Campylobacter sp. RM9333]